MKKIIQIAPVHSGGQDGQSSLIHLFALCEDGKVWVQYQDFGGRENPLDTTWQPVHVNPPVEFDMDDEPRGIDIVEERIKAESGDCKAQYTLSEAYRLGMYGLPCDLNLAHVWRQRSQAPGDNYGNEVAQTNASSASTSIPCHRIVNLLMLAQAGTSEDQFNVGYAYYLNDGGNRREDLVESVKWFKMAAAQGHADAQSLLSNAYFTGEGVEKDTVLALYWHNQARISVKKEAQQ